MEGKEQSWPGSCCQLPLFCVAGTRVQQAALYKLLHGPAWGRLLVHARQQDGASGRRGRMRRPGRDVRAASAGHRCAPCKGTGSVSHAGCRRAAASRRAPALRPPRPQAEG